MPPVIFNKLVNHCRFKNINGLICKPISFNESKNEIIVEITNPSTNNTWQETWNDLNAAIVAFQIGEYLFID